MLWFHGIDLATGWRAAARAKSTDDADENLLLIRNRTRKKCTKMEVVLGSFLFYLLIPLGFSGAPSSPTIKKEAKSSTTQHI